MNGIRSCGRSRVARPTSNAASACALCLLACAAFLPLGEVEAQAIPPPPAPSVEAGSTEATTSVPSPVAPASVPSPVAPASVPSPSSTTLHLGPVPLRPYAILWAGVFVTEPVQSFGYATATAPTAAANPALFPDTNKGLLTFQVQQTRVGVAIGEGTAIKGIVEIDFIHFDLSSPTTQAFPRLRIALLEWKPTSRHRLFLGQTWDIFGDDTGPLLSHSFNLVGTLFQAGNIGFMRQQLGWIGNFPHVELAVAAGLQGANTGPSYNFIEESMTPTVAARVMVHLPNNHGDVGISGLATSLRFTSGTSTSRQMALGGELFADVTFGALNVHAELYLAQNLANLGSLNLGQGRFGTNVSDAGGYLSAKYTIGEHAFTAMAGAAVVLNPSHVVPAYTAGTMMPTVLPAVANTAAGPGILHNATAHVGYWYSPVRGLSIVLEPYVYVTKFKLATVDVGNVPSKNVAFGTSLGAIYQF